MANHNIGSGTIVGSSSLTSQLNAQYKGAAAISASSSVSATAHDKDSSAASIMGLASLGPVYMTVVKAPVLPSPPPPAATPLRQPVPPSFPQQLSIPTRKVAS